MSRRRVVPVLLLTGILAACVTPAGREEARRALESAPVPPPSFAPLDERAAGQSPAETSSPPPETSPPPSPTEVQSDDNASAPVAEEPTPPAPERQPEPAEPVRVAISDPRGDVEQTLLDRPPSYVDILGVVLIGTTNTLAVEVTVDGEIPDRQVDEDRTMNVAIFLDTSGDGTIDHEVWTNLADAGWFPAHRDNRARQATFGAETGIEVEPEGRTLIITIPWDLVGRPNAFRWITGTEWGSYASLGTAAAARDWAPDASPASYP